MGGKNKLMKNLLFIVSTLIPFIFFFFLKPQIVSAQNVNIVEPFLIIPSNWEERISQDDIQRYKENILRGLEESRQFYSSKLGGHTFVYDSNVQVVKSNAIDENQDLFTLGLKNNVIESPYGHINILFIVGYRNNNHANLGPGHNEALINHQTLESLGSSDNNAQRIASGIVSHELGHTFGLSYSGFANGHPCSIVSKPQCRSDILGLGTSIPYPPASDCRNSVMGLGYCPTDFSNLGFANSEWNPEIQRLFKSRFINPNADSSPSLTTPAPAIPGKITQISPNPAVNENELVIKGSGFGTKEGFVMMRNADKLQWGYDPISWKDSEIRIVPWLFSDYATEWQLSVQTELGEIIKYPEAIIVQPNRSVTPIATSMPNSSPFPSASSTPSCQLNGGECVASPDVCDQIGRPFVGTCSIGICCQRTKSPTPEPSSSSLASPTPISTPIGIVTSIKVSNYNDFRLDNALGDNGNTTQIFTNQLLGPIIWKKSTLNSNSLIYITPINSDGTNGEISTVPLSDGQLFQVPNSPFIIQAKVIKEIVKIVVGTQEYTSDFTQKIRLHLPGVEGQSNSFPVPIVITYSDGSSKQLYYNFNYNPLNKSTPVPSSSATPAPTSITCRNPISGFVPGNPHTDGSQEWGGSCTNGVDTGRAIAVPGTCGCTVAQCLQYSGGPYCWVNNGQVYNDPIGCSGKGAALPASCFSGASATSVSTPQPTASSCVPVQISPCNPVCDGTPQTCGQPTTCTDSCGTTYQGRCDPCQ